MLIGLTGRYCAGKNHVAKLLETRGCLVLDVDKLGHQAIENEREAIIARFGQGIRGADGSIDRKALGGLVFGKPEALAALEAIVHPEANRLTESWIAEHSDGNLVINAALLHRSSVFARLDGIILVRASILTRLIRAIKRDRLPLFALLKRFRSQKRFDSQYYRNKTDIHIVRNKGAFAICAAFHARGLERRIDSILTRIGMVR